jgi:hypothetical protein
MEHLDKKNIEKQVLEIVNESILKKKKQFDAHEITIAPIKLTNNGSTDSYYSEIEIEFWKSNNLIDALSVIIFMEGKAALEINNLETWLEKEFNAVLMNYPAASGRGIC